MFDLFTVLIIGVGATAIAGGLLLVSWLQSPSLRALALWATSFAGSAVGLALVAGHGDIPDFWSVPIAGAILAASYGLLWMGARRFEGRSTSLPLVLAGTLVWLIACQFDAFYASFSLRASLMSAIVVAYSLMSAVEFWRGRAEPLMSRWLIIGLLLMHALLFLVRIPMGGSMPLPVQPLDWFTFTILEIILYAICISYMLGRIALERTAHAYEQASLTDPLTGIANRRDFLARAEALLQRTAFEHQPVALLLFDLDDFKRINDTQGHHVGDKLLTEFCRVADSLLRPADIFGRIGGEEFGCLIPHASLDDGRDIAERIRVKFAVVMAEGTVPATVSAGIAVSLDPGQDLSSLMVAADRALYRAKAHGRNRVECAPMDRKLRRV
jgi:diguanylate cyclase (GGDEF)-like protein